jgi:PAS domain S-box-containing protein
LRKDGSEFLTEINLSYLQTKEGLIVLATIRDITERKQAGEVQRETDVALANALPGISRLDPERRYVHVNEAYAHMLGYEPSEMVSIDWALTVHPDDRGIALAAYQRMLNEGKAEFEARAVRKDGSIFHKHILMVKRVNKEGNFIGHYCFMRDISERQRAEAIRHALYQASLAIQEPLGLQERLDRLLHTVQTVLRLDRVNILLADPEGRELQAVASLGVEEPLEAIRVPIGPEGGGIAQAYRTQQAVIWDGRAPLPAPLRLQPPYDQIKALRSRAFVLVPLVVQGRAIGVLGGDWKHTRRPLDAATLELLQLFATQAALAIEHGRLYETQRMAAIQLEAMVQARTRELQTANAQLQEATRAAEAASRHKSAFLAKMSHELRTPLNSILGFSEVLLEKGVGVPNAKQARFLTHIWSSGKHLLQLINDILDLAKVEAGTVLLQLESLPVAPAIEDILVVARGLADQRAQTLEVQVEPKLPLLRGDPVRFKQILLNVLGNAVKFTPEQGRIVLAVRQAPGDLLEVRVADTGIGIRAEDLPRLFQDFVQLEAAASGRREGTGLGLSLTKRLVELHGGRIWAESEGEGRGATFTVVLPFGGPRDESGTSPEGSAT